MTKTDGEDRGCNPVLEAANGERSLVKWVKLDIFIKKDRPLYGKIAAVLPPRVQMRTAA